ncbi:MAG: DUF5018 domain-containing protein [Alistipes sp.]
MKKLIYILALAGVFASCHEPEKLEPTTTSIGLTSVSAMFNDGDYKDKLEATFSAKITDLSQDIVIVVPWFFPESSDNQITDITNMKVTAAMDYNCFLSPMLGVLDLTKPNYFTYTDGRGEHHDICIRGEIRKLSGNNLLSLSTTNPTVTGVINQAAATITFPVPTATDMSACEVEYSLSAHASSSMDGKATFDFETNKTITITAHDGTKKVYTIQKVEPPKINYGFRVGSETTKWSINESDAGIAWTADKTVSLAVLGNFLVVSGGDGTAPAYLNRANGQKIGNINIGSADATGSVRNDDAGNLLICNHSSSEFKIWKTTSVTAAPTLLLAYTIDTGFPMGYKIAVQGDINTNALILVTVEGIADVSTSSEIVCWPVTGGVVGAAVKTTLTGVAWGNAPANIAGIVPFSANPADGLLMSYYDDDQLYSVNGTTGAASVLLGAQSDGTAWMTNNNSIAIKEFNKARYAALLCTNHFPQWSGVPILFMYDMTELAKATGTIDATPVMVFKPTCRTFYSAGDGVAACGDVILVPSTDGYMLNLYYIEHNNAVIEAYEFDCIQQ